MTDKYTVISPADILLPDYPPEDSRWETYSVIACDQFTSEPEYWEKVRNAVGASRSTYGLILPEAYLGTALEGEQSMAVENNMKSAADGLKKHENCLIYIERTLPDGRVRPGIVGKLDLEAYDFSPDSASVVRATEETVISRIPPRVAVRKKATVELPHVMVFANDTEKKLIAPLFEKKKELEMIYSFTLMQGGGSIKGYKVTGDALSQLCESIAEYENSATEGLVYAMGDGNHSLASAKAHFEDIKKELGEAALAHPARYALVEVVDLLDSSIEFEPIYRLVKDCDADALAKAFKAHAGCGEGGQKVTVITKESKETVTIAEPAHALTVGSLQMFLDDYLKENKGECDYIHGEDTTERLAASDGCVGFIFDGMEKSDLFGYVEAHGALPRKTFSMGAAKTKRYYTEARKIVK